MSSAKTLFEKIWDEHIVVQEDGAPCLMYVDLHLVHEVTSPQAFTGLRARGLKVRRPDRTVATIDHSIPTVAAGIQAADKEAEKQVKFMEENAEAFGVKLFGLSSSRRGIVHVIGPELGLTQPGMTIVCGDSHTSTHGAFGALAFGIGTSEVEQVLASQCVLQRKPKSYEVRIEGRLGPAVTAKDIILALLSKIGIGGGTGHVFEYTGSAVRALSMEERMTVCNMSIEGGARAGMIAPDETTIEYLKGRAYAPVGREWDRAVERWRRLPSDVGARYDSSVSLDAGELQPMITYGTNPGMGMPVTGVVPDPNRTADDAAKEGLTKSLAYMGLQPGERLLGKSVDVVFIGSCTNSRLSDLRLAAGVMKNRKVAQNVRMLVVPGSQEVKRQAESEGLDRVFLAAGAEWRESGCSMCIAMNGDQLEPGQYAVSTSNRNFEGRQGKGGRTFLASPLTAAAAAVAGKIVDVREMVN